MLNKEDKTPGISINFRYESVKNKTFTDHKVKNTFQLANQFAIHQWKQYRTPTHTHTHSHSIRLD